MKITSTKLWLHIILVLNLLTFTLSWNGPDTNDNHIYGVDKSPNRVQRSHSKQPVRQANHPKIEEYRTSQKDTKRETIAPLHNDNPKDIIQNTQNSIVGNNANLPQTYNNGFESIHNTVVSRKSLSDFGLSDLLIAADIEGGLHAISRENGHGLWSMLS